MSRSVKVVTSTAGALAALFLAACGSDGGDDFSAQSAKKISDQSEKDMKALTSLTLEGDITDSGEKMHLKLSADRDGTCTGSISMGGGTADLLGVDGAEYLRGDEKFWTATAGDEAQAVVTLLGNRWAKLPADSKEFSSFCDLDELFDSIGEDSGSQKLSKGKVAKVVGKDAVEVNSVEDDGTTHAWVATGGKHYVLKLEREGEEPGSMLFSDFNEPVDAKAPAKGDYVDLDALG